MGKRRQLSTILWATLAFALVLFVVRLFYTTGAVLPSIYRDGGWPGLLFVLAGLVILSVRAINVVQRAARGPDEPEHMGEADQSPERPGSN